LPEARSEGRERGALLFAAGALAALQTRVEAAIAWLEEAAALASRIGDDRLEAYALNYLGLARSQTGDPRGAGYSARAQRWFREANDLYGLRLALLIEGTAALAAGDAERAEALNPEGIEVARRFGQDRELAIALGNTATVHIHRGDTAHAEQLLREALHALRRDPSYLFIGRTLDLYAEVLGAQGDGIQAARVMAAADAIRAAVGGRPFKLDMDRRERLIPVLRAAIGDQAFDRAWADGAMLQPDSVLADLLDGVPELEPPPAEAAPAMDGMEPADNATIDGLALAAGSAAADAAGRLEVRALGNFDVRVEGERVPSGAWPYCKPKELLLLLLLYSAGRTRDQIAHALWPAATPAQAKNRFHVTLHHLRKALGRAEWVVAQGGRYRLAPEVDIDFDADRFENDARAALNDAATDAQQLRTIIDAERGDLFEGETPAWIEDHRARLRRLGIDLRLQLGELLERADDTQAAEAVYREVIVREEFEEEAHRRLMALRARAGSRTDALRHYERLAAHLEETLDAEPEPETIDLYERIRAAEPV
jgi:DNA-binding SARP family transcriptional activator